MNPLQDISGLQDAVGWQIIKTVAILVMASVARAMALMLLRRREPDLTRQYRMRVISNYAFGSLALLAVIQVWFTGMSEAATAIGIVSAGLAIALKDWVANMAGWAFILWRRPFKLGDRIQVGEHRGDVVDLRLFEFALMEVGNWIDADARTGRVLYVPNGIVLHTVLANYSKGWFEQIWNELPVLVTFESNWAEAKAILETIASSGGVASEPPAPSGPRQTASYLVMDADTKPAVFVSVRDCGVLLTLRYLCSPRNRRGSEHALWQQVLEAFGTRQDIDFAYPTTRFVNLAGEQGPAIRPRLEG